MKVLFWNLKGNDLKSYIEKLITEHEIDVAVFAEYDAIDFHQIESDTKNAYRHVIGIGACNKITLLIKSSIAIKFTHEQSRYIIVNFEIAGENMIMAGTHLQDRWSTDTATRLITIRRLIQDISNVEERCGSKKTIIIGDFNANPYDDELLLADAFNAVLFKDVIKQSETCKVADNTYRRFYNPILNFISEDTKMYGSFHNTTSANSPVWHCLDQVIVSKALCDRIININYLKNAGKQSLISRIKPNSKISDHLPLLVDFS